MSGRPFCCPSSKPGTREGLVETPPPAQKQQQVEGHAALPVVIRLRRQRGRADDSRDRSRAAVTPVGAGLGAVFFNGHIGAVNDLLGSSRRSIPTE